MKIVQVLLAEVGETPDMYISSYNAQGGQGALDALLESTQDGTNLSPSAMLPVAGSILRPVAQVRDKVGIANGFNTRRFRVTIVAEIGSSASMVNHEVISGFTDHADLSHGQQLDRNMRIFINNTSHLSQLRSALQGSGNQASVLHSTQILTPLTGWSPRDEHPIINNQAQTMRPQDVFTRLSYGAAVNVDLGRPSGGFGGNPGSQVLADTRTSFGSRAKRSSRLNNQNTHYLSQFFNQYRETMWDQSIDGRDDFSPFSKASGKVADPLSAHDAFLSLLGERTGYNSEWSFTWQDLLNLDSTVVDRTEVLRMAGVQRMGGFHVGMDAQTWTDAGPATQVARMVSNIIPGTMVQYAVGLLHFRMTNATVSGQAVGEILDMKGIAQAIDVQQIWQPMLAELTGPIMQQLSNSNAMMLNLDVRIAIAGISTIHVGFNGEPSVPYTVASYCDALFAPTMTYDTNVLGNLADELGKIGAAFTAQTPTPSPQFTGYQETPSAMNDVRYQESYPAPTTSTTRNY